MERKYRERGELVETENSKYGLDEQISVYRGRLSFDLLLCKVGYFTNRTGNITV